MQMHAETHALVRASRSSSPPEATMKRLRKDLKQRRTTVQISIFAAREEIIRINGEIIILGNLREQVDAMLQTKQNLEVLENEYWTTQKSLEALKDLALTHSHPIRKIPPEVLSYIFELAVETNLVFANPLGPLKTPSAVSLSVVCSWWRELALNSPTLWARISVYLHHRSISDSSQRKKMEYLQTVIKRARDAPLAVTIEFHAFQPENDTWPQHSSVVKCLLARPWRSTTIRHAFFGEGFLSIEKSGLGLMKRLESVQSLDFQEVIVCGKNHSIAPIAGHPLFRSGFYQYDFSKVRTLLLPPQNRPFSNLPTSLRRGIFNGSNLTILRICAGEEWNDTLELLRFSAASNLTLLSFHIFPSCLGLQRSTLAVQFLVLRELVVEVTEPSSGLQGSRGVIYRLHPLLAVQRVLQSIECFSLQSLVLQSSIASAQRNSYGPKIDVGMFREFIERSELKRLYRFGFCGFIVSESTASEMVEAVPGVREVKIGRLTDSWQSHSQGK